ncbi:LOG family protein [Govanella unica]|uniref:Cytokinin riboside 5'-monophosphate phosphoribohydrolase n=1 Tax=Govanella unica TaxID=2975056 RepID=A0A9X3TWZ3_9PROT|nr:TIGR00730 family Rossman fold protein [Govania unica]MDA5193259.1 TIGR00730 family Rossman fold protein [Govania unica]
MTARLELRSLCVYCGSKTGNDPDFALAAEAFGRKLASENIRLVYGGGAVGLMGLLARSLLTAGGAVNGIIPGHLDHHEITQTGLTELHVVPNMHSRKRQMFEESDAFVALPGSIGTLDELIEVITWRQLGLHDKPIIIANLKNYWAPFLALIDHVIAAGYASPATGRLYQVVDSIDAILPALRAAPPASRPDREDLF